MDCFILWCTYLNIHKIVWKHETCFRHVILLAYRKINLYYTCNYFSRVVSYLEFTSPFSPWISWKATKVLIMIYCSWYSSNLSLLSIPLIFLPKIAKSGQETLFLWEYTHDVMYDNFLYNTCMMLIGNKWMRCIKSNVSLN